MEHIPASGWFYANKFARIALDAYKEVMGKKGLNATLNLAGLGRFINNYPPNNLEREFDFADLAAIYVALDEMYGPRGGRGLALRAGRAIFNDALRTFGALAGVGDQAFKVLPLQTKLRIILLAFAKIFSQFSDQLTTVNEAENEFIWTIHRCPYCWGRHDVDEQVCYVVTGLLQAMLRWVSGGLTFFVNESKCVAVGDEACEFVIRKEPIAYL
jgi:predicted hydrocarbon binding protein